MPVAVSHKPSRLSEKNRRERIRARALKILKILNLEEAELSIVLCNNEFIRDLNKKWRNKDKPTDVLSFPEASPADIEKFQQGKTKLPLILGDIIISLDTVNIQKTTTEDDEILRLIIHGIAHLLGHDHINDADAREMEKAELEIVSGLGTRYTHLIVPEFTN